MGALRHRAWVLSGLLAACAADSDALVETQTPEPWDASAARVDRSVPNDLPTRDGGAGGDGGGGGAMRDGGGGAGDGGGATGVDAGGINAAGERCNQVDDDGDGMVDEGCPCAPGTTQVCYNGPPATRGRASCRDGMQRCAGMGEFGDWGACEGATLPRAESCNGVDDDCDGAVDEDCQSCMNNGASTPWQIHYGEGPRCWGRTFDNHGDPAEYAFARIPAADDAGWMPHAPPAISFDDPSTLCGVCDCRAGGDFTYFQTSFFVPSGTTVRSLRVSIANVDDGVSVAVFNSRHPMGIVDPGAYAYLGGGSTADLAMYVAPGRNRVVLTHVDDCCMVRRIANATITLNGEALQPCPR